jgi:hypothetical protein
VFLAAALLHTGLRLSIGPLVLALGRITAATIVEGTIAVLFALTSYALLAHVRWARGMAIAAHGFALVGVLVGLAAVSRLSTPDESLNIAYHGIMVALILAGLILLFTAIPGAKLRRGDRGTTPRVTTA